MYTTHCRSTQSHTGPRLTTSNTFRSTTCSGRCLASQRSWPISQSSSLASQYKLHRFPGTHCAGICNLRPVRVFHTTANANSEGSQNITIDLARYNSSGIYICLHSGNAFTRHPCICLLQPPGGDLSCKSLFRTHIGLLARPFLSPLLLG